jgi:GntR family transcriptional regulator/MocR family aminotransferase
MDRGVQCAPEQVVILNSTQQAIDLTARLLLEPGDSVWFEDPGYVSARNAFTAAGARLVPVPVDAEGLDVARAASVASDARLAYVTPSHQYPLGVTLSLARRLELLEWASRSPAWILEDDYDSELRHEGRPLASLQSMDVSGRVLYAGTFNKILFPSLRVAYLVLPPELVDPFARAKELADGCAAPLQQAALAEFIVEGHFSAHLRRVRELYRARRDQFLSLAGTLMTARVRLGPAEAGMHIALHLPGEADDARISAGARRRGLATPPLSAYCITRYLRGLLVHYGNAPSSRIEEGTRILAELLR